MDIVQVTAFFGWMSMLNFALLMISTISIVWFGNFAKAQHHKMFGIGHEKLGEFYFTYLAQFKMAWLFLNVVPYLALRLMG